MVRLLVASVVAALLVPAAAAALVPVPLVVQQAIKQRTSALGYVPARVPFGFRYARWSYAASPQPATRIWFRRRLKPPSWQITFVVAHAQRAAGVALCRRAEGVGVIDGRDADPADGVRGGRPRAGGGGRAPDPLMRFSFPSLKQR